MADLFDSSDAANPGHYNASQTALLLLDFHKMFVNKVAGPKGPAALDTAARMRHWAKAHNVTIIHGVIGLDTPAVPTAKLHSRYSGLKSAMQSDNSDKEPEDITTDSNGDDEFHFTRPLGYVSALSSPGIMDLLRSRGIKSLILTGLSTSGCVLRSAADACEKEFVTTVISDGCADPADGVHEMVVEKVLPMTAFVATADEFVQNFDAKK